MMIADDMRLIQVLDSRANLKMSQAGEWYVSANVHICDGELLSGISWHAPTPELAVASYLKLLQNISDSEFIVTDPNGSNKRWRWSGSAWDDISPKLSVVR